MTRGQRTLSPPVRLAFADARGRVLEHPDWELAVFDGQRWRLPLEEEILPLPAGSDLFVLEGRLAVGYDARRERFEVLEPTRGFAAACFLAPAYLRTELPACVPVRGAPALPLYAYAPLGVREGRLVSCGLRVDPDIRQDPWRFDLDAVREAVAGRRRAFPRNRLIRHLTVCALQYQCRAAQNYFLGRFEAPLPAAPGCNAACVGCISAQRPEDGFGFPASHRRIDFVPEPGELVEVAVGHLEGVARDPIVSFGQGCEGEPLLQVDVLAQAIRGIRRATAPGVVHLNTNASRPEAIQALCRAGLDSIRISTNSARSELYEAYYRPRGYSFEEVRRSARIAKQEGGFVALNYFVFPGVSDAPRELDALCRWIEAVPLDMLQLRNLNVDPDVYLERMRPWLGEGQPLGVWRWLEVLRRRFPDLRLGYFNPGDIRPRR